MVKFSDKEFTEGVRMGVPFWSKKAEVAAVEKSELLRKLMALNTFGFRQSDETDLCIDQKDESKLGGTEITRGFKAWLLLDEGSHEARWCSEATMNKDESWIAPTFGGSKQKMTWKPIGGTMHAKGATYVGGKKVSEYDFDVGKLKKIVEENGWKFKTVFRKESATYKK
jgi:hypothetical protein